MGVRLDQAGPEQERQRLLAGDEISREQALDGFVLRTDLDDFRVWVAIYHEGRWVKKGGPAHRRYLVARIERLDGEIKEAVHRLEILKSDLAALDRAAAVGAVG